MFHVGKHYLQSLQLNNNITDVHNQNTRHNIRHFVTTLFLSRTEQINPQGSGLCWCDGWSCSHCGCSLRLFVVMITDDEGKWLWLPLSYILLLFLRGFKNLDDLKCSWCHSVIWLMENPLTCCFILFSQTSTKRRKWFDHSALISQVYLAWFHKVTRPVLPLRVFGSATFPSCSRCRRANSFLCT